MFLFIGLGNPGNKYDNTPHNIGFMIIDCILQEFFLPSFKTQFSSLISLATLFGVRIIFLKPATFMNNSGYPVLETINFYKIQLENVIVFHDDIDLKFGNIRIKKGGSSAGHNGIKSIDNFIGKDYWRVRFGVGKPKDNYKISDYVLSKFQNLSEVKNIIKILVENISLLVGENKSLLMNKINVL